MELRTRSSLALLPTLMCLACGTGTTAEQEPTPTPASIAPTPTLEAYFAPATRGFELVARAFITAACEYDAAVANQHDFLAAVEHLVTPAELTRLKDSPRARVPWAVLRSRHERTDVVIDGISTVTSSPMVVRVVARISVTTHTSLATVQALEQVTLALSPTSAGWKVDYASGAGL